MPEDRSDIGTWLGIGAVAVFFLWLTRKPYRIVIFVAMLGAGGWWATRYEAEQQQERAAQYQQKLERRAEQEAAREAALPYVWYQQAKLIAAWESHLGSLPKMASSETWRGCFEGGLPIINRSVGGKLEKLVSHDDIAVFVKEILPRLLSEPGYQSPKPVQDVEFFKSESAALDFLGIKRDSDGLYEWDGRDYGQDTYGQVNPAAYLSSGVAGEPADTNSVIANAYAAYLAAQRDYHIDAFENHYLPNATDRVRTRILEKEPALNSAELETLVREKLMGSSDYRELVDRYPDYRLPESLPAPE